MSKNKFIKRLIALGIATVSAASIVGMAACGGGDGDGEGGGPKKLATPTNLVASTTSKKLTWTGDSNASSYTVFEKLSTAASYTSHTGITACEYDLSSLAAGQTYSLYVQAIGDGESYSDSDAATAISYTAPIPAFDVEVSFVTPSESGVTVPSQTIQNGGTLTAPTVDLTWAGHVFVGWYTAENGGGDLWNFAEDTVIVSYDAPHTYSLYAYYREETQYDILKADQNNIIAEEFDTKDSLDIHSGYGTRGIYKNNNVAIINNGHIEVPQVNSENKVIVDFGHVKGQIKGYFEAKLTGNGNSWTLFRIIGTDAAQSKSEIFGIRTDGGKYGYRIDAGSSVTKSTLDSADGNVAVEYTVTADGKVTFSINGTAIATEVQIPGYESACGFEFVTGNSGARRFESIDYIAVVAEEVSVSEYAQAQAAKFEAKYAGINNDDVLGDISTDVPVSDHKNNITNASTHAAVDSAYKDGVTACDAKLLENAKAAATTQINNHRSSESFTTNAEAWSAAKAAATTAIGGATTVAEVKTKLAEEKAKLDLIENDTQAAKATITVQIIASLAGVDKGKIGETSFKSGESISVEDIKAACDETTYTIAGFYNELACTTEITGSYNKTASTSETVQIYAKVTEKDDFTAAGSYTFTVTNDNDQVPTASAQGIFTWSADKGGNNGEFKYGGSEVLTISLKLKAGQTVALTLNDCYTGSTNNPAAALITAGSKLTYNSSSKTAESGILSGTNEVTFEVPSDKTKVSATINYTANTDGEVTITIVRTGVSTDNSKKTFRLTSVGLVIGAAS